MKWKSSADSELAVGSNADAELPESGLGRGGFRHGSFMFRSTLSRFNKDYNYKHTAKR